ALEAAVEAATSLYQLPRAELPIDYLDVLTAQNELFVAIRDLIETKGEQLFAIVNAYQALGGGGYLLPIFNPGPPQTYHKRWWRLLVADLHPDPAAISPGGGFKPPSEASEAVARGPDPLPSPPGEGSPRPFPTTAATAERGSEPLPTPPAAGE